MNRFFSSSDILDYTVRPKIQAKVNVIEMSDFDSAFVCGLIKKFRPPNILEVGVSAGGTTCLILEAIKQYDLPSKLVSVDLNDIWYKNKKDCTSYPTAWQVYENFGNSANWTLYTGKYLPEYVEKFETKFDLCILDTVHSTPGELLDFPVILQLMNHGGIIAIHDIIYHLHYSSKGFSNQLLLDCCVGNKIICQDLGNKEYLTLPNIGAVVINKDTYKYINNIFSAFGMPWAYEISDKEFEIYRKFYAKYYGSEYADLFYFYREAHKKAKYIKSENNYKTLLQIYSLVKKIADN